MVKVRKTRIEQLVNEGNFNAKIALEAIKDLDKFIAAVQLGVTISSIGLGWVGEGTLARIIEPIFAFLPGISQNVATHTVSVSVSFALITFLHVVIGELIPKIYSSGISGTNFSCNCKTYACNIFYFYAFYLAFERFWKFFTKSFPCSAQTQSLSGSFN